jgi:selenocysteine lyase/cysteine desulfurase
LTIDSDKPEEFIGSMAGIRVPTNLTFHSEDEATAHALWLHNALWENYRIEIPIQNHNKVIYLRISCQIYNTKEDYIVLRDAIKEIYKL